jgi:hypothetical protein
VSRCCRGVSIAARTCASLMRRRKQSTCAFKGAEYVEEKTDDWHVPAVVLFENTSLSLQVESPPLLPIFQEVSIEVTKNVHGFERSKQDCGGRQTGEVATKMDKHAKYGSRVPQHIFVGAQSIGYC